jgi:hypothetical protein
MNKLQLAFIEDNLSEDIIDSCLEVVQKQEYDTISAMPNYLKLLTTKSPSSLINLMIDFPWPVQEVDMLQIAIAHYVKKYQQIRSVTFGGYLLQYINQDWKAVSQTVAAIVKACQENKIAPIFFTDLNLMSDFANLEIVAGMVEQEGCEKIIIGAESSDALGDLLIESYALSKAVSIPVGIISAIDDQNEMETFMNAPFNPKLILAENILNFVFD